VFNGSAWVAATLIPGANDTVYLQAAHAVKLVQTENVRDFNIFSGSGATTTSLNLGVHSINVSGQIKQFSSAINTFPVTYTTSNSFGTSANWLNCTAGGRIRFVGNSRSIAVTGAWSANPQFWQVDFAMNAGQTATVETSFKAGEIRVISGNALIIGDFRPDSGTSNGDVYINPGASLELRGNSSRTGTLTVVYDSLVVNGTLILSGNLPTQTVSTTSLVVGSGGVIRKVNPSALVLNYTNRTYSGNAAIEYASPNNQIIGGEFIAGQSLPKLIINCDSSVTFNGSRLVTDSLVLLKGIVIVTGSDSLRLSNTLWGTLVRTGGWINGKFTRFIGNATGTFLFPTGTLTTYRPSSLLLNIPAMASGDITIRHVDNGIGGTTIPAFADGSYTVNRRSNSYWDGSINNGFTHAGVNMELQLAGQSGIAAPSETRIISSADGGATFASVGGSHANGSGTTALRNGVAVISPLNFRLYLGGNNSTNPLPVKLVNFKAAINNNNTLLSWATSSELNNVGFNVEFSLNGKDFTKLGFVKGAVNSSKIVNYHFEVEGIQTGYYRLKQIDVDGSFEYSATVLFEHNAQPEVIVSPNPFNNNIEITGLNNISQIEVIDITGKVKISQQCNGSNAKINTSELNDGIYFIRVSNNQQQITKRIIKH